MCHVDDTCPRCGRMKMERSPYYGYYHCLRCGRIEQLGPPWASRDRRKHERRGDGDRRFIPSTETRGRPQWPDDPNLRD